MKSIIFSLIAVVVLVTDAFAFGGRSVSVQKTVIRQQNVRQRNVVVQQVPVVVQQAPIYKQGEQMLQPVYSYQAVQAAPVIVRQAPVYQQQQQFAAPQYAPSCQQQQQQFAPQRAVGGCGALLGY